jgi:RNA polymerase sigma-70 factor (ECF subfamily)
VTEHYDRLLRLAWLVCRDGVDAADAVQAGLEVAWRQRATLRDAGSLRPWLDRIVVRAAGRTADRRRSWLGRILSPRPDLGWIEPADRGISDRDDLLVLRAALARLSPDHRAVIALHLHAGYSVAETAELVGAPLETVRSRLRVARERLRRDLGEALR